VFGNELEIDSAPALTVDGKVLVAQATNLFVLDGRAGTQVSRFTLPTRANVAPTVGADGTIYIGLYDGTVVALDGGDGHVKWSYDVGFNVSSSAAIGADRTLYIGSMDGFVYALGE
jgi:outer membrane protein assembly factor BamB